MATTTNKQQWQQLLVSLGDQLDCSSNNNNHHRLSPVKYNLRLAQVKAHALAETHAANTNTTTPNTNANTNTNTQPAYYLGSDTIIELDGAILDKPRDGDNAKP